MKSRDIILFFYSIKGSVNLRRNVGSCKHSEDFLQSHDLGLLRNLKILFEIYQDVFFIISHCRNTILLIEA